MSDHRSKNRHKGFVPVMLTPFEENGAVDYNMLSELTEFYIEAGAVGLFANCLSSEMFDLTPGERFGITKQIVEQTKGTIPVVATGNFGVTIADQADSVKRMYDTGVEAVILTTSLLAKQDDPDVVFNENAMHLLALTGTIPVGFYECPVPYKRILNAGQLAAFLETNRLVYYKDTCLNIDQVREKIKAAEGYYDFRLYDAYMVHAVESLSAGADGLSCIQGNFFPEIIVWLCERYDNPRLDEEVKKVQQFLAKNMDVMHTLYPVIAKYYLQKRGMKISVFSRNNVVLNDQVKRGIDELFDDCSHLKGELKI